MFFRMRSVILCVILSIASVAYATYQISPVKLVLTKKEKVASLNFKNDTNEEKSFQVTVMKRDKSQKTKTYQLTKDLIASPVIFKTLPGKGQLIRIALKNPQAESEEDDYRVFIKEVPQGPAAENEVRFITEMSIPVRIRM